MPEAVGISRQLQERKWKGIKTMDDSVYNLALVLVQEIGRRLERGLHILDCAGKPLFTLDEVMRAVEEWRWPVVSSINLEKEILAPSTEILPGGMAMNEEKYTHTVHCFDDKSLRKHFVGIEATTEYANKLLMQNHKVKIYLYRPQRRYVDILAERGPNG
jgi:hypothetical protein